MTMFGTIIARLATSYGVDGCDHGGGAFGLNNGADLAGILRTVAARFRSFGGGIGGCWRFSSRGDRSMTTFSIGVSFLSGQLSASKY